VGDIDRGNHIARERPPERVEDGYRLGGTGAQPSESLEDFAGPRNLEKPGGPAALA
jgi:hypothetical protein